MFVQNCRSFGSHHVQKTRLSKATVSDILRFNAVCTEVRGNVDTENRFQKRYGKVETSESGSNFSLIFI